MKNRAVFSIFDFMSSAGLWVILDFPASLQGRGGREPSFVLELSKFMARRKVVGKFPLGGVFECAISGDWDL